MPSYLTRGKKKRFSSRICPTLRHAKGKKGWNKVQMTCRLARKQSLAYAWIDTCCIDKSSSAELSEAINSMFEWYQMADICYAYLSDLAATESPMDSSEIRPQLERCKWLTRGWTLQELICPHEYHILRPEMESHRDQGLANHGTFVNYWCGCYGPSKSNQRFRRPCWKKDVLGREATYHPCRRRGLLSFRHF